MCIAYFILPDIKLIHNGRQNSLVPRPSPLPRMAEDFLMCDDDVNEAKLKVLCQIQFPVTSLHITIHISSRPSLLCICILEAIKYLSQQRHGSKVVSCQAIHTTSGECLVV